MEKQKTEDFEFASRCRVGLGWRRMSLTTDLPQYHPDLVGDDPGDECYIDLTPKSPSEETRMLFCWCPPSAEKNLPGFWLGKHLVTQAQWVALGVDNWSRFNKSGQQPVDSVSWGDTGKFAEKSQAVMPAGYELWLPTEAQWERASLAGIGLGLGPGSERSLNSQMANFNGNHPTGEGNGSFDWLYREKTLPVGCFPPNDLGLHDMHGQLWEWCADRLDKEGDVRVLRGGSWSDSGLVAAVDNRYGHERQYRLGEFGLRVCPCSIQTRKRA